MSELRRLFRVLMDNPARIKEGPDWLRRRFYVWRRRRFGPSGYVAGQERHRRFLFSRERYDHLRLFRVGDSPAFPEMQAELLPSPDEGIDIAFSNDRPLPSSVSGRVASAQGFSCVATPDGWRCTSSTKVVEVRRRSSVDLRSFNPIGRRVDTGLIHDRGDPAFLEADDLRAFAAFRIPHVAALEDQMDLALRSLACGTAIVIDPGSPLATTFSGPGMRIVPDEAPLTIGRLGFDQPFAFEQASAAAFRTAFWEHSTWIVADEYVGQLGFRTVEMPTVSILLLTRRPELLASALEGVSAQNYANVEIVVGLHGVDYDEKRDREIRMLDSSIQHVGFFDAQQPFGDVLDCLVESCNGRLVAKFDDDDWYGADHLSDLVAAWMLTRADVVGKTSNFVYLEASDRTLGYDDDLQYRRVEHIPGGTMLATRDLLVDYRFGRSSRAVDSVLLRKVRADGGTLFSTTRQGFMRRRHSGHTAGFQDDWFVRRAHGRTLPGLRLDLAGIGNQEAKTPREMHHG